MTLPSPGTKTGYAFNGWYTDETGGTSAGTTGASYTTSSSVTLHAQWTAISYTVAFDGNGSTSGSMVGQSRTYDDGVALTANAFSRTHYTFASWNTASGGVGTSFSNLSTANVRSTAGTTTLYAQWTPVNYTISTGVTPSGSGSVSGGGAKPYGSTQTLTASPNTHYTFTKWQDNNTSNPRSITVTGNATYTATFTAKTYTVSFDTHGGTACASQAKQYGTGTITLPTPSKTGATFAGWYTTSTYTTKVGDSGASYQPTATTTLHAKWVTTLYYIDVYNGVASNPISSTQVDFEEVFTAEALTRSHYVFKGWQVTENLDTSTGKWGTTSSPSTAIASRNTVCYNGADGNVYFKGLNPSPTASNVHVKITALWERKSYAVTVNNTGAGYFTAVVSCSGDSFQHWNGSAIVTVDPKTDLSRFYAGVSYTVTSTYKRAKETDTGFKVLRSWGGYAVTRTNAGSGIAVFTMTHTMGDAESATQTWSPVMRNVRAVTSSPFEDVSPSTDVSFDDADTDGTHVKAVALPKDGVAFTEWTTTTGTPFTTEGTTAKFQVTDADVSMTASYHKANMTVTASLDTPSATACGPSQPTISVTPNVIQYRDTATASISGIPSPLVFAGWYANGSLVSESTSYSFSATANVALVAKLKATVTLSKQISEETQGTVDGSLVLNGTTYMGSSCSQTVVIGDTISIGVTLNNANTSFICWYDSSDPDHTPLNYERNQSGIVVLNTTALTAYLMDHSQEYYVAFYNRNASTSAIASSLGQLTPSGTSADELPKIDYFATVVPVTIPDGSETLSATPVHVEGGTHYEWRVTAGSPSVTHVVKFVPDESPATPGNGTWKYAKTGVAERSVANSNFFNTSIVFGAVGDVPATTLGHADITFSGSNYNDGLFVKFNSTQKMQLSIVKTGALEYLRCKRFAIGAASEGSVYSTEQTVVSVINQNFVFIAEWGTPVKYTLTASLASSGDLAKGSVDLGGYVTGKSYGGTSTTGQSEADMLVAVWAKAKNGYDFSGWYTTSACTGDPVSTSAYYEFDMPAQAKTLYAKFVSASVSLYKWEGANTNLQLKWVSKVYALSKPANLNAVRVDTTGYPVERTKVESFSSPNSSATSTVDLTGSAAVANQGMRRLPARRPERFFQVTVESTHEVDAVVVGTSGEGLAT